MRQTEIKNIHILKDADENEQHIFIIYSNLTRNWDSSKNVYNPFLKFKNFGLEVKKCSHENKNRFEVVLKK